MSLRRYYYNTFSPIYDKFVALHSGDHQNALRSFLADMSELTDNDKVLDICTGTGTLLLYLRQKVGKNGLVVGVDFSRGMLTKAQTKIEAYNNIALIESDASSLPFKAKTFDAVTCSHAFYELKGEIRDRVLEEIVRVVKPDKPFLMMEHDVPENFLIRILFYIRIFSMGTKEGISILKHEIELLKRYFKSVKKIKTFTGKSKIIDCRN